MEMSFCLSLLGKFFSYNNFISIMKLLMLKDYQKYLIFSIKFILVCSNINLKHLIYFLFVYLFLPFEIVIHYVIEINCFNKLKHNSQLLM